MAKIHITEIQQLLAARGERDALPHSPDGYLVEIGFDNPESKPTGLVDPELQNKALTAETPYGLATIVFDDEGQLKAIDLS